MNTIDIKKIREKFNLTQEKLAELIGVSRNTIINYEKGGKIPESKRQILNNITKNNAQYDTTVNEPRTTFKNGFDEKIEEIENEINTLKEKIKTLKQKIKESSENLDENSTQIKIYEERILLFEERINLIERTKNGTIQQYLNNQE